MSRHNNFVNGYVMQTIWAEQALTSQGWQSDVCISVDDRGVIISVEPGSPPQGAKTGILLPSPINLHSHSFQRAMAGLSEHRGPMGSDNFWTWRNLMYRFVGQLNPDDMAAISAFVQMEMLEAGFAGICEFHYVHHQPDGTPYNNIAEMSDAIIEAADQSGIGLTLLPVLYQFGGCDERPLGDGQRRFGNTPEQFGQLFDTARSTIARIGNHSNIGVAPHSLRAVSPEALEFATKLAPDKPIHMHLAEQVGEVEEVRSARGRRPVEWLYENHEVNERWCLIHLTQMNEQETAAVAKSGAVAGLCPLTESSLGDGTFNGRDFIGQEGFFGIGSDSNIQISLAEELRTLEYSQRLHHRQRAIHRAFAV